ncbi:hypothetical protein EV361DRAFT_881593 [Lentinula raphanica]|nr:hypothetical protein EV361DRAFT_881593 [Lentinula raphanica]
MMFCFLRHCFAQVFLFLNSLNIIDTDTCNVAFLGFSHVLCSGARALACRLFVTISHRLSPPLPVLQLLRGGLSTSSYELLWTSIPGISWCTVQLCRVGVRSPLLLALAVFLISIASISMHCNHDTIDIGYHALCAFNV